MRGKDDVLEHLRSTRDEGHRPLTDGLGELRARLAPLERHVVDLDVLGYTVIENALSPSALADLRGGLLSAAAEDDAARGGAAPVDLRSGAGHRDRTQEVVMLLTRGGRAYEELLVRPEPLQLITYLLGRNRVLSSMTGYVKGPGSTGLGIHSDTAYVPDPVAPYAQLANVNYCLSDYTRADGCLRIVPGSHRYGHRPRGDLAAESAVPVEAPAGSAIVFHGNTWHGAHPRTNDGLRLTVSVLFARSYLRPQEHYGPALTPGFLDRNPPIVRDLLGLDLPTGWSTPAEAADVVRLRREKAPSFYRSRAQHT
ncbi:phytanoyl-CoA dioxygenase family protein [Kitasatospora sp. NPDC049258]|uniref:phytanoyl-CoA dioxygenase family protein n=1 Tax=Kitasatospora sp. NPDC049258 TaxID=3155394 RepID=UPI003438D264